MILLSVSDIAAVMAAHAMAPVNDYVAFVHPQTWRKSVVTPTHREAWKTYYRGLRMMRGLGYRDLAQFQDNKE